jgi:hypothetical protein
MKRNYLTPACSQMGTVLRQSLLLVISGNVENPGASDAKLRDSCKDSEDEKHPEWGTLWQ